MIGLPAGLAGVFSVFAETLLTGAAFAAAFGFADVVGLMLAAVVTGAVGAALALFDFLMAGFATTLSAAKVFVAVFCLAGTAGFASAAISSFAGFVAVLVLVATFAGVAALVLVAGVIGAVDAGLALVAFLATAVFVEAVFAGAALVLALGFANATAGAFAGFATGLLAVVVVARFGATAALGLLAVTVALLAATALTFPVGFVDAGFAALFVFSVAVFCAAILDFVAGLVCLATLTSQLALAWHHFPYAMLLNNISYGERGSVASNYINVNVKTLFTIVLSYRSNSFIWPHLGTKLPRFTSTKHRHFLHPE